MYFLGIDPGVGGGIAVLTYDGEAVFTGKMPYTERDLLDLLRPYSVDFVDDDDVGPTARATLEAVSASPQMGVVSAFTFGKGYGRLEMALTASRIPWSTVRPAIWQTALGCRSGGDKNVTKRRAQQLFPKITITHAIADALLIADYGRRMELGLIGSTRRPLGKKGTRPREETPHQQTEPTEPAQEATAGPPAPGPRDGADPGARQRRGIRRRDPRADGGAPS